jgi:hypothetical protein
MFWYCRTFSSICYKEVNIPSDFGSRSFKDLCHEQSWWLVSVATSELRRRYGVRDLRCMNCTESLFPSCFHINGIGQKLTVNYEFKSLSFNLIITHVSVKLSPKFAVGCEPCFLLGWLRSSAFRPGTLPFIIPPGIRVVTHLPLAHHPFLPRDFPFLPCLERKTSFRTGEDMRAVCCLPSVSEVGRKIPFRSGLSELCSDS